MTEPTPGKIYTVHGTGKREGRAVRARCRSCNTYWAVLEILDTDKKVRADGGEIRINHSTGYTNGAQTGKTGWKLGEETTA